MLDEPADSFVEGFVGKDRGYRSLSFQPASGLPLGDVQVVRDAGSAGGAGPVLVVDGDARPTAWADPARPGNVLPLGATFDPETDSLRAALDAALTSPVGLAVAVTGDPRRYAGVVDADMILRQVTQSRAQIAESIAVRTHDRPEVAVDSSPERPADTPASEGATAYDPDATSIRGVEPVETVPTVAAAAAVGATQSEWSDDEDPDATRIAGPLPEAPAESADADGGPTPPVDPVVEDAASEPYGAEAPSTEDQTVATAYDAQLAADDVLSEEEWQTAADEPSAEDLAGQQPPAEREPAGQQPPAEEPPEQPPASRADHGVAGPTADRRAVIRRLR